MSDKIKEDLPPKKGLLTKLKERVDDKEEQIAILSTFVRLGILVWSGAILTLAYVDLPKIPKQDLDPTFIASVFTGVLATFGVQAGKKAANGGAGVSKGDLEALVKKASETAPHQTITIESPKFKLVAQESETKSS